MSQVGNGNGKSKGHHKPTQEEWDLAFVRAKGWEFCDEGEDGEEDYNGMLVKKVPGVNAFQSSNIKHKDEACQQLIHHLGPRWANMSLDTIRELAENVSKAGREWKLEKDVRTEEDKIRCAFRTIVNLFEPAKSHSDEYHRLHASEEFRSIVALLKRDYEYRCQLCNRVFDPTRLEGHIVDYEGDNWKKPGRLLILCRELCHPVADNLRRIGKERGDTEPWTMFEGSAEQMDYIA